MHVSILKNLTPTQRKSAQCGFRRVDQDIGILPLSQSTTQIQTQIIEIISLPHSLTTLVFSAASINSSTTSYHLTGLKEKTIYRVEISGFTKAGEGSPSFSPQFSTLKYGTVESACYCVAQQQSWLYMPLHKVLFYTLSLFPAFQGITMCSCTGFIIQFLVY